MYFICVPGQNPPSSGTRLYLISEGQVEPLFAIRLCAHPELNPELEQSSVQDKVGLCPRTELNCHQRLRKPLFYPLNYEDFITPCPVVCFEPLSYDRNSIRLPRRLAPRRRGSNPRDEVRVLLGLNYGNSTNILTQQE